MSNEEFQRLVLEKLAELGASNDELKADVRGLSISNDELRADVKNLSDGQKRLELGQELLREKVSNLELGQEELKRMLKAVVEQTADLTEFRQETGERLDTIIENNISINQILGEHEISIRTLRRLVI